MTTIPVLYSGPMVRALLEGRKTQTRRMAWRDAEKGAGVPVPTRWQKVKPGDQLWVREAWRSKCNEAGHQECVIYCATDADKLRDTMNGSLKFRPSIHMPRWASRLTLEVTAAKMERLQDISEEDAIAEGLEWIAPTYGVKGVATSWHGNPRISFAELWKSIYGPGSWDDNPEVVALSFRVIKQNIDDYLKERS